MEKIEIACESCEGVCKIHHNLDSVFYEVKNCPFCGEEIDTDNIDIEEDDIGFYGDDDDNDDAYDDFEK